MIRNRNGFWMDQRFFAPDDGGGAAGEAGAAGDNAPGGDGTNGGAEGAEGGAAEKSGESLEEMKATIAKLTADLAKEKAAKDAAMSESGKYRKELRARQTQEEIDAEAKKAAEEARDKELDDLRKRVARGETVKSVMGKLGLDEEAAGNLADHLYGAADIDNALLEIQKGWQAREAALRKEYGKITGPGAGADSNSPEAQGVPRAVAIGKSRNAVNEQAQKAISTYMR